LPILKIKRRGYGYWWFHFRRLWDSVTIRIHTLRERWRF